MPTEFKGQKRPADVIGNAIMLTQIAIGKQEETMIDDGVGINDFNSYGGRARVVVLLN